MLVALMMGFSCGLPLLLTISVLQAWMKEEGVDLTVIGMMALVGLPYTLKFLWAPFLDRFTPPLQGASPEPIPSCRSERQRKRGVGMRRPLFASQRSNGFPAYMNHMLHT